MFQNSYLKMSSYGLSTGAPKVVINDIEFYYSKWEFYDIDIIMAHCNTLSLYLYVDWCNSNSNLTNITHVNIYNCTLRCWKFQCVNDAKISDCFIMENPLACDDKRIVDSVFSTFILENIFIQNVKFDFLEFEYYGLVFDHFSKVIIKNLSYERNINASILVANGSSLVMEDATVLDNDIFNGVVFGGASDVYITNSTFDNNIGLKGGVVCITVSSLVIVRDCTFTNNQGLGTGGGITIIDKSTLVISNSTFTNNMAGMAGGGVFVSENSRLDISGSIFDGNTAFLSGGGVYVGLNSSFICTSSNFFNNRITASTGGAIRVHLSNATLSNLAVTQNYGRGAVAFVLGQFANVHNCTFNMNSDGAVYVHGINQLAVWNCDFFHNEAPSGGAIFVEFSEFFTVSNVRFVHNVAVETGGAISIIYTNMFIDNCILDDNLAYFDGGAMFTPSGNISIQGSYF